MIKQATRIAAIVGFIAVTGCEPPSPPALQGHQPDANTPLGETITEPELPDQPTTTDPVVPVAPSAAPIIALTRDALEAWRHDDLDTLLRLAPRGTAPISREGTRFEAMFGADSWRSQAIDHWSGGVIAVRVAGTRALAHFTELADGRLVLAESILEDGAWRFVGIVAAARPAFAAFGTAPVTP